MQHRQRAFNSPRIIPRSNGKDLFTETARQRFSRLGPTRVANAVNAIRLLANFSRDEYEVRANDVAVIKHLLDAEVKAVERALSGGKNTAIIEFEE